MSVIAIFLHGPRVSPVPTQGKGMPPLAPHPHPRVRLSPPLRKVSVDEVEQFAENQKGQRRFAPMVFAFGPEWCSASFRNAVQLSRNPHTSRLSPREPRRSMLMSIRAGVRPAPKCSHLHRLPESDANVVARRSPITAPTTNAGRAVRERNTDNPGTPAKAKPGSTILPVILAVKTCPRPMYLTVSIRPATAVNSYSNWGSMRS
jgi:hypothetical protein